MPTVEHVRSAREFAAVEVEPSELVNALVLGRTRAGARRGQRSRGEHGCRACGTRGCARVQLERPLSRLTEPAVREGLRRCEQLREVCHRGRR